MTRLIYPGKVHSLAQAEASRVLPRPQVLGLPAVVLIGILQFKCRFPGLNSDLAPLDYGSLILK